MVSYDPYGTAVLTAGGSNGATQQNPYLFKDVQVRTTGWVHFGARWYDPGKGRFTQQDTLDSPLDPANANRYAYTGDDPTNNLDPTGTDLACAGAFLAFAGSDILEMATAAGGIITAPTGVGEVLFGAALLDESALTASAFIGVTSACF